MYICMYSFVMIEFDEAKRASNILKHGIDFTDALGRVITVIWTTRGNNQRIISARASRKKEAAFYQA